MLTVLSFSTLPIHNVSWSDSEGPFAGPWLQDQYITLGK